VSEEIGIKYPIVFFLGDELRLLSNHKITHIFYLRKHVYQVEITKDSIKC
jgi:hypothetical protein